MRGRPVEGDVEADVVQGPADAPPDLVARDPEVLAAEGDVVAASGQDDLGLRVLQHQSRPATQARRLGAADEQPTLLLALVLAAEDAGEPGEQRGLAGAGGAEQQHALPGLDHEVEAADGERLAPRMPPAPAVGPQP